MPARTICTITLGALIVLAGCSTQHAPPHTPHPDLLAAPFLARANAICAAAVRIQTAHPFPLEHFNPTKPDPAQLPAVAAYFSRYGRSHQLRDGLDALGDPPGAAGDWRQLRTLIHQLSTNADTQIAAARRRDVAAFETTVAVAASLQQRIATLGTRLGFAASDPCAHEFG